MAARVFKLALIQMKVSSDKMENVRQAVNFVATAKANGSYMVALPECFNSPYGTKYFPEYAEDVPSGATCTALSQCAKENQVYLIGGSIPERDGDTLYNTCTVWGPTGELLAKHRKVHLFDINIPNRISFKESEVLTPGSSLTTFDTDKCKFGLGICFDMRFEEMAKLYRLKGCEMLIYPGAFNNVTGPMHWELLARARAVDNQVYFAAIAPARDTQASYISHGHSLVVDPWGNLIASAAHDQEIVYASIDLNVVDSKRQDIPIFHARRTDLYDTVEKTAKSA